MPDSVYKYIDAAINTMQQYSIRKDSLNWKEIRANTFEKAKGATSYDQTYPAIRDALFSLGDNHSFFKTPEQHKQWLGMEDTTSNQIKLPEGKMIENNIGFITINSFFSGNPTQQLLYASKLHEILKNLDSRNPSGWVIDLRWNRGGNMWPMLAGIGPLLGEGALGRFVEIEGKYTSWSYCNGEARMDNKIMMKIPHPYKLKNFDIPVAVFISDRTASSGEAILISFIGRPNTKTFGSPTAGLTTGNRSYFLPDGAQLILTSTVFADRKGNIYGQKILPDIDLSGKWFYSYGYEFYYSKKAAKEWMLDQNKGH